MKVHIRKELIETLQKYAEQSYPQEMCGLLIGKMEKDTAQVLEWIPVRNEAENHRERRYLIPANKYRDIDVESRKKGMDILGVAHSHPDGKAEPSSFDLEHAYPHFYYFIFGIAQGHCDELRIWQLSGETRIFEETFLQD